MIADLYKKYRDDPAYNKLVGSDYMIIEYKCPIETERFKFFTELNFIVHIITGRKDWFASGKTFETGAGDALFIRKGAYTTKQYFEVDNCVLLFFMTDDFIRNFIRENHSVLGGLNGETVHDQIFQLDVNETLRDLFQNVFNYLKAGSEIPRNLVELKFKELLFNIVLNSNNKNLASFFTSLNQSNKTNLENVMMKNFQFDLQLEEFAGLCGRSLSAFKRDFQNFFRQSPGKWLIDKRLEYARDLLLSSDLNINEICYESGFKNTAHFNKAFKDKFQLPPQKFRVQSKIA